MTEKQYRTNMQQASLDNLQPSRKGTKQARERGRKGGIKSGESRRAKKKIKDSVAMILSMPPGMQEQKQLLQAFGIEDGEATNQVLIALSMVQSAIAGDVKAATWVRDTVGEKPTDKIEAVVEASPLDDRLAEMDLEELRNLAGLNK